MSRALEAIETAGHAVVASACAGRGALREARTAAGEAERSLAAAAEALDAVADASAGIVRVALSTRLIAFEASVEARRAGESGRGASLVSEAVRDLATAVERATVTIAAALARLDDQVGPRTRLASGRSAPLHDALRHAGARIDEVEAAARRGLRACAALAQADTLRGRAPGAPSAPEEV